MTTKTLLGMAVSSVLMPDTVVGGRFLVGEPATMLGTLAVYHATDQKTQRKVALWVVPPGTLPAEHVDATRRAIRGAAAVVHKDLVAPYGSMVSPDGTLFVATEVLGETSVADLIEKKRHDHAVHALAAAYPLVAHAANALTLAHASLAHGAAGPALLRIDAKGRVKLAGLGLLAPLLAAGAVPPAYLAPEVRRGTTPTAQSDIYSVGAILYELLTGRSPDPNVAPSSLVPALPPTLDIILESCLAESPEDRFESASALKGALAALVAPTERPPPSEELDIEIEFDAEADPATAEPHAPRPVTLAPGLRVGDLAPAPPAPPPAPASHEDMDLKQLLDAATTNDADRWMYVHDGLDHGPLTARDVIQAIIRGELVAGDDALNMESGERRKVGDWPQYREFAATAAEKRLQVERRAAAHAAIREEGVGTRSKLAVGSAAVLTVAAVIGVYFTTLSPAARQRRAAAEIDGLIQRGQLQVQTQPIQLLPPPPPSQRRHTGGGGGGGGGGSYEAAMSAPIDFNFGAAGGPRGGTLSDGEIVRPLNANLSRFGGCLRDGSARNVQLSIAIGGTGRAIGVTVHNGSGAVKSCVAGVVRSLGWRAFGGPRIGLRWGFGI